MKSLTLTQPWATLVAVGEKMIETRSWQTSYRGVIAIHAAKGFPDEAKTACRTAPFMEVLARHGIRAPIELPIGAVIAVADLFACEAFTHTTEAKIRQQLERRYPLHELSFGDFSVGRFGFWFRNVVRLPEPIPARGMLNLWDLPASVAEQIQAAVR